MLPDDDPRHGTYAGYAAHYTEDVELCEPCRRAGSQVRKKNTYLRVVGRPATVPALGTIRRLQALRAIGWNITDISRESGVPEKSLRNPTFRGTTVYRSTAEKVAATYDRLCMTLPEGGYADRCRNHARRMGWPPPLAWADIDDPDEQPRHDVRGTRDPFELQRRLDMAVVWRLVDEGVRVRQLTGAEAREAYRILAARGLTGGEIERRYGINAARYGEAA